MPQRSSTSWVLKCTDVPQYDALQAAAEEFQWDSKLHLRNLCNDSSRCAGLTAVHMSEGFRKIILDYSRQQVTGETMELLFDLADAVSFTARREAMRVGARINTTEDLPVLHHALRMPRGYDFSDCMYNNNIGGRSNTLSSSSGSGSLARVSSGGTGAGSTSSIGTGSTSGGSAGSNPLSVTPMASPLTTTTSTSSSGGGPAGGIPAAPHHRHNRTYSQNNDQNPNTLLDDIHAMQERIFNFTQKVRKGKYRGITGQIFTDFVVVGCGGAHFGTQFVQEALQADPKALHASQGRKLHFLSNGDPVAFYQLTRKIKPETTLVLLISKNLSTSETILNSRAIRSWLVQNLATEIKNTNAENEDENVDIMDQNSFVFSDYYNMNIHQSSSSAITEEQVVAQHMVAVTCNVAEAKNLGVSKSLLFPLWEWVGERYSVCSAMGLLPLSLLYSFEVLLEFLKGAHDVDEHFFNAPLRDNIPVLLGLLGVWNSTFMGYGARAILPYSQALSRFPAHVQQVDMESNGKRVALDGQALMHPSGEITFGEPGTDCQHSFFQLMHQGRVVPADFIGFMESQQPMYLPGEAVSCHDECMSNFFAQPDALAYGKTLVDLIQEGVPDGLREHMVFTGNRPSSSLLMTRLDAYGIGQLLAIYEHRTAVQGFIWGINSFDQYGVELGKLLAKHVRGQLSASRRTGASVQGFNLSTSSLLEAYLAHGKQKK